MPAPVDGAARLVKRFSHAPCDEGRTWGQRGDRVWVTDGQDYTGRCPKDSTWGVREGVLWVTNGCQGRFELTGGQGGGALPVKPGQQQRAEVACRNEAQRQGIEVRRVTNTGTVAPYWYATVDGVLRGQTVRVSCRFDPNTNRATLSYNGSGGGPIVGPGADLRQRAQTACSNAMRAMDYLVASQIEGQVVPNGYRTELAVHNGNRVPYQASCFYESRSGDARIEDLRRQ